MALQPALAAQAAVISLGTGNNQASGNMTAKKRGPSADECVMRNLIDRHAREIGDTIFIVYEDGSSWTYRQLREEVAGYAAGLQQQAAGRGVTEIGAAISDEINAAVVAISTLLIMLPAGAMIIVAKAGLTLMLGIGPLFIMCLMWPPAAKFFDGWFGQCLNYILRVALLSAVCAFAVAAFSAYTTSVNPSGDQNTLFTALCMAVMAGILFWLLYETNHIASALAGGMSSVAVTLRNLASPVTGGMRTAKGVGDTLNPTSTRRDLQSGMMSTGTRFDHMVAGNTILNPAYRQAIRENIGRNWATKRGGKVSGS